MKQQSIENKPSLDLPPVHQGEQSAVKKTEAPEVVKQLGTERNPELTTQAAGQVATGAIQDPLMLPKTNDVTQTSNSPQQKATPAASSTAVDDELMIADDLDLIEKEWVERAKRIVQQTKDNPHEQNKEINKVKAEYIKKRYNRELRTNKE